MEHYKSRNNDFFHFTNPHDDASELDDDDDYDELQYDDVDDDRSCDFNFYNFRPIGIGSTSYPPPNSQPSGVMNENDTVTTSMEKLGTFDYGALFFHLDNTMKNLSDKLHHTIEGIGTQISSLEDETCKIDNHVEDLKNFTEKYHGTTHMKLKKMHNVLQEVQDDVLFLKDKHEIAETKLQLAKLQGSKRDKEPAAQTNPHHQQPLPSPQSSFHTPLTPLLNQPPSNGVTFSQDSQVPHFTQSYLPNSSQGILSPQNHPFLSHHSQETSKMSSFSHSEPDRWGSSQEHEEGLSHFMHVQSSRNYKSEFHAKYMPEFASFSNNELPFPSNYTHTPEAQPLPHALPTAVDVEDRLSTEGNGNTIPVDDIVDKVTAMGFRRDLVRASVRKLTENGSSVDLNTVLDKMMNNK
ncbi:unnamed protein product [Lactuca virosa]|uniref:DUF1421 domain-containing protein n=1 Tax=Lactuca virosa TaxID=75947 RepID=A0AAU9MAP3_9ASTR|nr:unnamed protein product [Lactuca virosa]